MYVTLIGFISNEGNRKIYSNVNTHCMIQYLHSYNYYIRLLDSVDLFQLDVDCCYILQSKDKNNLSDR